MIFCNREIDSRFSHTSTLSLCQWDGDIVLNIILNKKTWCLLCHFLNRCDFTSALSRSQEIIVAIFESWFPVFSLDWPYMVPVTHQFRFLSFQMPQIGSGTWLCESRNKAHIKFYIVRLDSGLPHMWKYIRYLQMHLQSGQQTDQMFPGSSHTSPKMQQLCISIT